MSFNRDKGLDRWRTQKTINNPPKLFPFKNWLDHSKACAKIDEMLLKGADFKKLLTSGRKPTAVRSHLYHLKTEHGLTIDKVYGLYHFAEMSDSAEQNEIKQVNQPVFSIPTKVKIIRRRGNAHCGHGTSSKYSETAQIKGEGAPRNSSAAKIRLVSIVRTLAKEKRDDLERLKQEYSDLSRNDFIWHYLLQSFSTMGRASGWHGLIGNKRNYGCVTYDVLDSLTSRARSTQVRRVCRDAGIRMPDIKAKYILGCFDYVKSIGGLEAAKAKLLSQPGREKKIRFLQTFPGIGPKYARNIMMDVYHEDFRDSIALDVRIRAISKALGQSFPSYSEEEEFYLSVAKDAGINGWELDRLLFNFRKEVETRL